MPHHDGGDEIIESATMRGQNWPCLRQFVIFLENRVGRLSELMRHVESLDIRVLDALLAEPAR